MSELPHWLEQPDDPNAPIDQAECIRLINVRRVMAERVGRDPASLTDEEFVEMWEELKDDKEMAAIIEADTIEHAGKVDRNSNRAIEYLAVQASKSGLHGYHPMHYGSVAEMLKDKLADLDPDRQQSEWSNLDWIANTFCPIMQSKGQNGLEALWQPGTKAKSRVLADVLQSQFAAAGIKAGDANPKPLSPVLQRTVDEMLRDVADKNVTVENFRESYVSSNHTCPLPTISGLEYMQKNGSILVLVCPDPAQIRHVKTSIKADWKLGTGKEAVLKSLAPKKKPVAPKKKH